VFIVELATREGKVCESYETYEEARRRVEQFPPEALVGLALIFQELPDGSQRLLRADRKPLQWHRLPEDPLPGPDEPVPLSEVPPELLAAGDGGQLARPVSPPPEEEPDDEPPLPLV
jgi:hypothetical protein